MHSLQVQFASFGCVVVKEKGFFFKKIEDGMPNFYGWLITSGWMCFSNEHINAYHILGAEFYADALETDFGGEVVITVSGVQVHFGLAIINALYGLQDADDKGLTNRYKDLGNQ
ncbi:hypothetical protein KY284_010632 [Solanum tuberosum]|nr:hypothetical protein KY284_010632 [Solanum tuberosum]